MDQQCQSAVEAINAKLKDEMVKSEERCLQALKLKDGQTKQMLTDQAEAFKDTIIMVTESNERNLNRMMDRLETQSSTMSKIEKDKEDLIKLNQLLLTENSNLKKWKSVGCSIMSMVNERRNEIDRKYDLNHGTSSSSGETSTGMDSAVVQGGNPIGLIN